MAHPQKRGSEYWLGKAYEDLIRSGEGITSETPKHLKQLALRHVFAQLPIRSLPCEDDHLQRIATAKQLATSFEARYRSFLWSGNAFGWNDLWGYFSALLQCEAKDELLAEVLQQESAELDRLRGIRDFEAKVTQGRMEEKEGLRGRLPLDGSA